MNEFVLLLQERYVMNVVVDLFFSTTLDLLDDSQQTLRFSMEGANEEISISHFEWTHSPSHTSTDVSGYFTEAGCSVTLPGLKAVHNIQDRFCNLSKHNKFVSLTGRLFKLVKDVTNNKLGAFQTLPGKMSQHPAHGWRVVIHFHQRREEMTVEKVFLMLGNVSISTGIVVCLIHTLSESGEINLPGIAQGVRANSSDSFTRSVAVNKVSSFRFAPPRCTA